MWNHSKYLGIECMNLRPFQDKEEYRVRKIFLRNTGNIILEIRHSAPMKQVVIIALN